jgi:N-acetylglucosaminyldiphosphoundecaprenol N-acetyl-beta-D-mannosaminyltransferase
MPVSPSRSVDIAGVPFQITALDSAVDWMVARASEPARIGIAVRLANAFCVTMAHRRPDYLQLLRSRGFNFPDGAPVAWAMRRAGAPDAGRVRGPSFFTETLRRSQGTGIRHYFFGTDASVLEELVVRVRASYPGAIVVGASAPDVQEDPVALAAQLPASITRESVDIVWVGLGTPKQDFVADAIAAERGVITAGVGAAFDFLAGSVREAPRFMQNSGLEWLFRLVSEPRRLWRRYLIGNVQFLRVVLPALRAAKRGRDLGDRLPETQPIALPTPEQVALASRVTIRTH